MSTHTNRAGGRPLSVLSLLAAFVAVGCGDGIVAPDASVVDMAPVPPRVSVETSADSVEAEEVLVVRIRVQGLDRGSDTWMQAELAWDAEAFRYEGADAPEIDRLDVRVKEPGLARLWAAGRRGLDGSIELRFLAVRAAAARIVTLRNVVVESHAEPGDAGILLLAGG